MNKIISNYNIAKEGESAEDKEKQSINPVIKIPVYEKEAVKIDSDILNNLKEPKLQLTRNSEGIVVGIEVLCTCGEKILIKLDYKL